MIESTQQSTAAVITDAPADTSTARLVLVVDDSLSIRKVIEQALRKCGLRVCTATSVREAQEHIERETPDLVLCDLVLPDSDGYSVARFVKQHPERRDVPVLLMSSIVDAAVRQRAAEVGSLEVLKKPFAVPDLAQKIAALLDVTAPISSIAQIASVATVVPTGHVAPATPVASSKPVAPAASIAPGASIQPGAPGAPVVSVAPVVPPATRAPAPAPAPGCALAQGSASSTATTALRRPAIEPTPAPTASKPDRATKMAADFRQVLAPIASITGVSQVTLLDRSGLVIESVGDPTPDPSAAAALAACFVDSSSGIASELGRGALASAILEYERGVVLMHTAGSTAILAVVLSDPVALGKVRFVAKKLLRELGSSL